MNKKFNKEQSRHFANSARMVGVGQFVYYGVKELGSEKIDMSVIGVTIGVYLLSEALAFILLKEK